MLSKSNFLGVFRLFIIKYKIETKLKWKCFLEASCTEISAVWWLSDAVETWLFLFFPSTAPPRVSCVTSSLPGTELPQNVKVCTPLRLDFVCSPWWEFILIGIYLEFNSLWEGRHYLIFQENTLQAPIGCLEIFYNPFTNFFLRQSLLYSPGRSGCFIIYFCRREGVWALLPWIVVV